MNFDMAALLLGSDLHGLFHGDLLYDARFIQASARVWMSRILGEEHFVSGRIPNHCLVKQGVLFGFGDDRERGLITDNIEKILIIDEKWLIN